MDAEYFILLCVVVLAQGIDPRDQFASESPEESMPIPDNLQVASSTDQKGSATGYGNGHGHDFGGLGHGHHGGYFQYAHNPDYGHYEFGYRRGNDYHVQERYEKAHDWKFKTKVKWADKYGGYGEHYYDYNHVDKGYDGGHGGHGHDGGHGGHGHDGGHGHGHYSEQVPVVSQPDGATKVDRVVKKRESRKQPLGQESKGDLRLTFDPVSGKVTDEQNGRSYLLQPVD